MMDDIPLQVISIVAQDVKVAACLSRTCKKFHHELISHLQQMRIARPVFQNWHENKYVRQLLNKFCLHENSKAQCLKEACFELFTPDNWCDLVVGILMYASANRTGGIPFALQAFTLFNQHFSPFLKDEFYLDGLSTKKDWHEALPKSTDSWFVIDDDETYFEENGPLLDVDIPVCYLQDDDFWELVDDENYHTTSLACLKTFLTMLRLQPYCVQELIGTVALQQDFIQYSI